jgi:hypothetical protein
MVLGTSRGSIMVAFSSSCLHDSTFARKENPERGGVERTKRGVGAPSAGQKWSGPDQKFKSPPAKAQLRTELRLGGPSPQEEEIASVPVGRGYQ